MFGTASGVLFTFVDDLPQISALDLSLVLAGADHCTVLTASVRLEPVADPRSDWFVRRLPAAVEDTIPN